MLYLAWRYGGEDPFRLFNGLDPSYRPWGQPEAEPRTPPFPSRVRSFIYACGIQAQEDDMKSRAG